MRPLKLELQAFGPYVTKQSIDFRLFEERSLFLIRGETGSGKTMILDAITYALYGKSSGGQREDLESMRSRFAHEHEDTYIDFTFSLQNRIFRFIRKVEVKTKKNKDKVCKVCVDAGEIIEGEYFPFFENPKLKNIEEKAQALIGLTHEQFIQVMILPQGKFEQLLTSKSEEKQDILKTLFQVEHWEKINAYLVDKLHDERICIEDKKQQIEAYLKGLEIGEPQAITSWLQQASQREKAAHTALSENKEALQNQNKIVEQQKTFHAWRIEQEEALKKEGELQQQKHKIEQDRAWIALQKKMLELKPYVDSLTAAKAQHTQRLAKLKAAKATFSKLHQQLEDKKQKAAHLLKLEESLTTITSELDKLNDKKTVYEQFYIIQTRQSKHHKQVDEAHTELKKAQDKLAEATQLHNELHAHRKALTVQLEHRDEIKRDFALLEQAHFLYQKQKAALQEQKQAQQKHELLSGKVDHQKQCLDAIVAQHEHIYRQFLNNSASQLAQILKEGEPCPVCGSIHHPMPYTSKEGYADIMNLKQVQEQVDQEKATLDILLQELQLEKIHMETFMKQECAFSEEIKTILHKPFDLQEYEETQQTVRLLAEKDLALKELQTRLEKGERIIEDKELLVRKLEATYQDKKTAAAVVETEWKNWTSQLISGIASLDELSVIIEHKSAQCQNYKEEIKQLRNYIQDIVVAYEKSKEEVKNCTYEAEQADQSKQRVEEVLYEQCKQRNITVEELANLKTDAQLKHIEEIVHTYDMTCVQIATTIENIHEKLHKVTLLNIKQLQEELTTMEERDALLAKEYAQIVSTKQIYEQVQQNIQKIQQELALKEPLYLKLNHFVKAMRGDNGIGIERYVLGVMLSSITQGANQLLQHVHQGRYQIYRSDEASGRTRKYGLELSIYDAYTCSYRSVVSLSGGEKFLVSLALSLSLSAVVQARNGGIHLEAMFIDEGFGTLDEHSIADALQVLQRMSSHKGIVGIISHVDLLKENISAGIEVIKTRQGSSLTLRKG